MTNFNQGTNMMRLNDKTQRVDLKLATSMVALVLASMAAPALAAADDQEAAAAEGSKEDTTIIVTGTRRTDRTVAESAVPIDVFSADDFKAQPSPQLQSILKTLVPSFNQNRNLLGDASAFVRPPNLRGLPADQILVLINGKRMHRSALVQVTGDSLNAGSQGPDLSQISSPAVSRIEVLRDGAAAQYGSDAIAGVINIGLNRADSGYNLAARYGQTYRGDGEDLQISANAGFKHHWRIHRSERVRSFGAASGNRPADRCRHQAAASHGQPARPAVQPRLSRGVERCRAGWRW